jgi:hypothetical protein
MNLTKGLMELNKFQTKEDFPIGMPGSYCAVTTSIGIPGSYCAFCFVPTASNATAKAKANNKIDSFFLIVITAPCYVTV